MSGSNQFTKRSRQPEGIADSGLLKLAPVLLSDESAFVVDEADGLDELRREPSRKAEDQVVAVVDVDYAGRGAEGPVVAGAYLLLGKGGNGHGSLRRSGGL